MQSRLPVLQRASGPEAITSRRHQVWRQIHRRNGFGPRVASPPAERTAAMKDAPRWRPDMKMSPASAVARVQAGCGLARRGNLPSANHAAAGVRRVALTGWICVLLEGSPSTPARRNQNSRRGTSHDDTRKNVDRRCAADQGQDPRAGTRRQNTADQFILLQCRGAGSMLHAIREADLLQSGHVVRWLRVLEGALGSRAAEPATDQVAGEFLVEYCSNR